MSPESRNPELFKNLSLRRLSASRPNRITVCLALHICVRILDAPASPGGLPAVTNEKSAQQPRFSHARLVGTHSPFQLQIEKDVFVSFRICQAHVGNAPAGQQVAHEALTLSTREIVYKCVVFLHLNAQLKTSWTILPQIAAVDGGLPRLFIRALCRDLLFTFIALVFDVMTCGRARALMWNCF
jgi:hypothetical protein